MPPCTPRGATLECRLNKRVSNRLKRFNQSTHDSSYCSFRCGVRQLGTNMILYIFIHSCAYKVVEIHTY